jgi:positive regulator of sigma E activity
MIYLVAATKQVSKGGNQRMSDQKSKSPQAIEAGTGFVLETDADKAQVRIISEATGCSSGSCASCVGGCHTGLFGENSGGRVITVTNGVGAKAGDLIRLESKPGVKISALTMLFGIPLVLFLLGFVIGAELAAGKDLVAVLVAFALPGIWYGIVALLQRRQVGRQAVWIAEILHASLETRADQ